MLELDLMTSSAIIFGCLFLMYAISYRAQKRAFAKVNTALIEAKKTNTTLSQLLSEVRRQNKLLISGLNIEMNETEEAEEEDTPLSETKIYIGNIDYSASEDELEEHFSRFGEIQYVNIPVNRYTGKTRGFGFVTFHDNEDARKAMSLNGSDFKGRQIQVNFAKERE